MLVAVQRAARAGMRSEELVGKVKFVSNPDDACMFIGLFLPTTGDPADFPHWNGGLNHVLWFPTLDGTHHFDHPAPRNFDPGFAMMVASGNTNFTFRKGFDFQSFIFKNKFFETEGQGRLL